MFFGAGIPISSETGRLWPGTFGIFLQLGRRKFFNIFNKIDQEFLHRECLTVKGLEKKHREQLWIQIEWTEIRKLSTSRQERMDLHYFQRTPQQGIFFYVSLIIKGLLLWRKWQRVLRRHRYCCFFCTVWMGIYFQSTLLPQNGDSNC